MKFKRAEQLADAKDARWRQPREPRPCPRPGPATLPTALSGRVGGPSAEGRSVADEECDTRTRKADERDPERHHVEVGKGHVFRAHLDGQKVIAEGGKGRSGENEEDHDGGMHGHQLQVVLRRHHIPGRAILGKQMQPRNRSVRPSQVDAHQPGKQHADQDRDQGQRVILLADDFVVQAENVLPDKASRRRMVYRMR